MNEKESINTKTNNHNYMKARTELLEGLLKVIFKHFGLPFDLGIENTKILLKMIGIMEEQE